MVMIYIIHNRRADFPLVGDARVTVQVMNGHMHTLHIHGQNMMDGNKHLYEDGEKNRLVTKKLLADDSIVCHIVSGYIYIV